MRANKRAICGLAVLLVGTVFGKVSVMKAEGSQLEEGLDAIEDAIDQGRETSDTSEGGADMQKGTSDNKSMGIFF